MPAERSSLILLIAIAGVMLLLVLGSVWWFHRTDPQPKAPMHSGIKKPLHATAQLRRARSRAESNSLTLAASASQNACDFMLSRYDSE